MGNVLLYPVDVYAEPQVQCSRKTVPVRKINVPLTSDDDFTRLSYWRPCCGIACSASAYSHPMQTASRSAAQHSTDAIWSTSKFSTYICSFTLHREIYLQIILKVIIMSSGLPLKRLKQTCLSFKKATGRAYGLPHVPLLHWRKTLGLSKIILYSISFRTRHAISYYPKSFFDTRFALAYITIIYHWSDFQVFVLMTTCLHPLYHHARLDLVGTMKTVCLPTTVC